MSYVSLLKNIPDFFSQPTGIAAIASLSIHGAIALIVPLMPSTSSKTPEAEPTKAVGLIELSPADQSRLPQIPGTSQVPLQTTQLPLQQTIPPSNYGNTLTILPPSPNIPQVAAPLPQLSPSNGRYAVNALPRRQVINRNSYRARLNLPSNNSNYSSNFGSPSVFTAGNKPNYETRADNFNRSLEQAARTNDDPSETPMKNPSPLPIDSDLNIGSGQIPLQERGGSAAQVNQNAANSGDKNSPGRGSLAYNFPDPKNGNTLRQPEENPNTPAGPQQAQLDDFTKLRQQVSQLYPDSQEKGVIRRTIATDKSGLEGDVVGRIVVDPNGRILKFLLGGSPSPELKSKAEEYFQANPPQGDKDKTSSYSFNLSFKRQASENTSNTSESKPESTSDKKDSSNTSNTPEPKPESTSDKKDNETTANPAVSNNPSPTPKVDNNQPVVIPNSQDKLIQKLRQSKQEEQNPSQQE